MTTTEMSPAMRSAQWVKNIKIEYNDSRGYYISELTPNPQYEQPSLFVMGKFIHEFNCLINNGMDVEALEKKLG